MLPQMVCPVREAVAATGPAVVVTVFGADVDVAPIAAAVGFEVAVEEPPMAHALLLAPSRRPSRLHGMCLQLPRSLKRTDRPQNRLPLLKR